MSDPRARLAAAKEQLSQVVVLAERERIVALQALTALLAEVALTVDLDAAINSGARVSDAVKLAHDELRLEQLTD